ncbi:MAG: ATP-dependent DNA helicase [Opitutales bacterium]|nr:ATP-dependent DNA helicase [Opitutales bacterium]
MSTAEPLIVYTAKIFAENGWLQKYMGMECRPQQAAMAQQVAQTLLSGESLLFEAGTGVGKSLAYLVPGLIYALTEHKKFVVSTHTIPLQEQIIHNDLPICRMLFSRVPELNLFSKFNTVLMIGKGNYLCGTRLAEALRRHEGLFDGSDGSDVAHELKIIKNWWAQENCSGIREHLPQAVSDETWELVNGDSRACSRKHCTPKNCARRRAQAALEKADIVVVNHSLLFSYIDAGLTPGGNIGGNQTKNDDAKGILYANDFVVLDEAHRVPDVATNYFGCEVVSTAVLKLLSQIDRAYKKGGVLAQQEGKKNSEIREQRSLIANAKEAADTFFTDVRFRVLGKKSIIRLRQKDWIENLCEIPFARLEKMLRQLADLAIKENVKDEISDFVDRLLSIRNDLRDCVTLRREPDFVYWAEFSGKKRRSVRLAGAPIDVAKSLAEVLFTRGTSAVLSSATLADDADHSMKRFRSRCGADLFDGENVLDRVEASPFDYLHQMKIFVATDAPEEGRDKDGVPDDAANIAYNATVAAHAIKTMPGGGTLILVTSFDFANKLGLCLRKLLPDREIFIQGESLARKALLEQFLVCGNAVLIGNQSFWTGVDVPGAALSQVIIPRLPFANPRDPIVEARSEWIKLNGGNPFRDMSVPEAVLQFRQGIGRLIRKADDRGRLIVTDSRVVSKPYGKKFLAALPHRAFVRFDINTLKNLITDF